MHTIVSWDFATAVIPGWHATIFPPYFVAGAIFSGMAMVLTLMIVARKVMNLQNYITLRHVDVMCKLIILNSSIVALAYGTEFFMAQYSGNPYEKFVFLNRAFGPFAWAYWTMVSCNVLVPLLLWFRQVRANVVVVFVISLLINVGMWFERFVIIVTSLHRVRLLDVLDVHLVQPIHADLVGGHPRGDCALLQAAAAILDASFHPQRDSELGSAVRGLVAKTHETHRKPSRQGSRRCFTRTLARFVPDGSACHGRSEPSIRALGSGSHGRHICALPSGFCTGRKKRSSGSAGRSAAHREPAVPQLISIKEST